MSTAVFGDFLAAANDHLEAATAVDDSLIIDPGVVAVNLHRVIAVMVRYCDDLAPCDEVEASSRRDLRPWERASIDMGTALRLAADRLSRGSGKNADGEAGVLRAGRAQCLAAAATALGAGRDLLHTHFTVEPDGLMRDRSEWAPAITSTSVTRALASEIGRWSGRLAPFTSRLAASAALDALPRQPGSPAWEEVFRDFAAASEWLQAAGAAARTALDADPVQAPDAELLSAIPGAAPPRQLRPSPSGEAVAELCHGISVSASRLSSAMRGTKDRARWSPGVTSGGWQWMAQAAAVTSHLSEMLLRALADKAGQLADPALSATQLSDAAGLLAGMRAAWNQADRKWDAMITESRLLQTPAMTDASDLVLRLGRLVWDDPGWTPARSRLAQPRPLAALAPEPATVRLLLSAVHQSVSAMAAVAKADMRAVETASRAGRLFVPTRSLPPDDYAVPRPYAPAPVAQCSALQDAYDSALSASIQAAMALDELAAPGTPGRALALALAAAPVQSNRRAIRARQDDSGSANWPSAPRPAMQSTVTARDCGPVEQAIRDRHVFDPVILLRAAAIDNAASQLIAQAEKAVPAAGPDAPRTGRRAAVGTVQLAAQSFPHGPATRPPAGQAPHPPQQAVGPGNRATRQARKLSAGRRAVDPPRAHRRLVASLVTGQARRRAPEGLPGSAGAGTGR